MARIPLVTRDQIAEKERPTYDAFVQARAGRPNVGPYSLLVTALLFALIFKVLPDADVAWDDVWFGAVATSVLFTLGKQVIGLYLGRTGVGSAYGAAGSLVVMTVWVYYASLILFFGAELTYVRSRRRRESSAAPGGSREQRPAKDPPAKDPVVR